MQFKNSSSTAILFFSRSAGEEARVKHFIAGDTAASQQVANCMINHSLAIIRKTGLPYYIINSEYQKGENFGERYSNAFADIFNLGFQKIISILASTKNWCKLVKIHQWCHFRVALVDCMICIAEKSIIKHML